MPCATMGNAVICSTASLEVSRTMNGLVAWCFRCCEYRAFWWVITDDGEYYGFSGRYRCDRCDAPASDFHGNPRTNLDEGGAPDA